MCLLNLKKASRQPLFCPLATRVKHRGVKYFGVQPEPKIGGKWVAIVHRRQPRCSKLWKLECICRFTTSPPI